MIPFHLPALRERGEDIRLLADHFLKQIAEDLGEATKLLDDKAYEFLLSKEWREISVN